MSGPTIHPRFRTISASMILDALGQSLSDIKAEDNLTDADLGAVLGKGDDQAAKYRTGLAEMGIVAYHRALRAWDGRFANRAAALMGMKAVPLDPGTASDRQGITSLMRAVLALQEALEDDGEIDDVELAQSRSLIEDAGRFVDQCRERLKLRAVA